MEEIVTSYLTHNAHTMAMCTFYYQNTNNSRHLLIPYTLITIEKSIADIFVVDTLALSIILNILKPWSFSFQQVVHPVIIIINRSYHWIVLEAVDGGQYQQRIREYDQRFLQFDVHLMSNPMELAFYQWQSAAHGEGWKQFSRAIAKLLVQELRSGRRLYSHHHSHSALPGRRGGIKRVAAVVLVDFRRLVGEAGEEGLAAAGDWDGAVTSELQREMGIHFSKEGSRSTDSRMNWLTFTTDKFNFSSSTAERRAPSKVLAWLFRLFLTGSLMTFTTWDFGKSKIRDFSFRKQGGKEDFSEIDSQTSIFKHSHFMIGAIIVVVVGTNGNDGSADK